MTQLEEAVRHIALDSVPQAEKIRLAILLKVARLATHPAVYPPDKYKKDNNGNFRAFELYRYRISYYESATEIRILRVRHTSREPKEY